MINLEICVEFPEVVWRYIVACLESMVADFLPEIKIDRIFLAYCRDFELSNDPELVYGEIIASIKDSLNRQSQEEYTIPLPVSSLGLIRCTLEFCQRLYEIDTADAEQRKYLSASVAIILDELDEHLDQAEAIFYL